MDSSWLRITVAYCAPGVEDLTTVRVANGATVRDAIEAAQIYTRQPELKELADTGIWGRRCSLDEVLAEGDRVEIYRPLIIDPKEGRRVRVEIRRKRS
ncbi:MAG TPA: RnfH family protein [Burkholderiaceae bacterium]|nr:RnfH family protein [Burkholderiaceae bacterium]